MHAHQKFKLIFLSIFSISYGERFTSQGLKVSNRVIRNVHNTRIRTKIHGYSTIRNQICQL